MAFCQEDLRLWPWKCGYNGLCLTFLWGFPAFYPWSAGILFSYHWDPEQELIGQKTMSEWILSHIILQRWCVMPLQWVQPLESESIHLVSIPFHFQSAPVWPVSIRLLADACVHFREPSASWYSQTASGWLAAGVEGAWWDQGTGSVPRQ